MKRTATERVSMVNASPCTVTVEIPIASKNFRSAAAPPRPWSYTDAERDGPPLGLDVIAVRPRATTKSTSAT